MTSLAGMTHQQLLDLEDMISERGSSGRPSTCGAFSGVNGLAASALGPHGFSRPTSAGARPGSARGARGNNGVVRATREQNRADIEKERHSRRQLRDQEFRKVCDLVGQKAAERHKTVADCFLRIDTDGNGAVERDELRVFFRQFNLTQDLADYFFDTLDVDKNNEVDYHELRQIIGPYIQPGYKVPRARPMVHPRLSPEQRQHEAELNSITSTIGFKAYQKYGATRSCLRFIDGDKDGIVTATECRDFVQFFGLPVSAADFVVRHLLNGREPSDGIPLQGFMDLFGPSIFPGYRRSTPRQDMGGTKSSGGGACAGRASPGRGGSYGMQGGAGRRACSARPTRRPSSARLARGKHAAEKPPSSWSASTAASSGANSTHSASVCTTASSCFAEKKMRGEVMNSPRGNFSWIQNPLKHPVADNRTFDSSQVWRAQTKYSDDNNAPSTWSVSSKGYQAPVVAEESFAKRTSNSKSGSEQTRPQSGLREETQCYYAALSAPHDNTPRGRAARCPARAYTDHRGSLTHDVCASGAETVAASI